MEDDVEVRYAINLDIDVDLVRAGDNVGEEDQVDKVE